MKKLLIFLITMFVGGAFATTVNMNWVVDGEDFAQTTCETGNTFSLPNPTPTKYGYTFVGWTQNVLTGTWSQSGTPTPTNPIDPVFYQMGNTVLRAVGDGNNIVADTYNPATQKITRNIGVKVFDGTEDWTVWNDGIFCYMDNYGNHRDDVYGISTHFITSTPVGGALIMMQDLSVRTHTFTYPDSFWIRYNLYTNNLNGFKQWLANQYANGTPVTVYYPLATPVAESYVPSAQ